MPDIENVIKGLRCIKGDIILCRECDYADVDGYGNYSCKINCAIDAIALLEEQKTRKGHWIVDETETYTENHDTWECSECHEPFTLIEGTPEENKFYFCPRCGADMR